LQRRRGEIGKAEEQRIAAFAARGGVVVEGVAGPSFGANAGALVLEEAIRAGHPVLFSLDAATYPTLAAKIGAWVLLDLVRVAGLLQEEGWADEGHQCYVVIDEFSALGAEGRHIVPLLARAREAGVACVVATQGLADLARVDHALPQQIVQNTTVRILLRQGSSEDALAWARHVGELEREELSRRTDDRGNDRGEGYARWRRDFYVRPEELQVLGTGEAIVHVAPMQGRPRRLDRVKIAQPPPLGTTRPVPTRDQLARDVR
jgi:type IV secretory pathway TraG/TraD family ATPase VirD4